MTILNVQKYLLDGGTPEQLEEDLGIKHYYHPDLPLIGFKYDQLDSPRGDPIVRECRGIVLENETWRIVAKPFNRFFNVGEFQEEFKNFDWSDFTATTKEDGSLIIVYYYDGWRINTSGSFAQSEIANGLTWSDLFWKTLGQHLSQLPYDIDFREYTLLMEMCTPYNQIVRNYSQPTIFLLGANRKVGRDHWIDCDETEVDDVYSELKKRSNKLNLTQPTRYHFHSRSEIEQFLLRMEEDDPTYEGLVLRDHRTGRWKWKTKTYVALHKVLDNGNILKPKRLIPLVFGGEMEEKKEYLPQITSALDCVERVINDAWIELRTIWRFTSHIENQKEFALLVKSHPLASILFKNRKQGGDEHQLRQLFKQSQDLLMKKLFKNVEYKHDEIRDNVVIVRSNHVRSSRF